MDRRYAPRPLSTSWEYPGYQFYAVLRYAGHDSVGCLRYAALTVQNWLCERIQMASGIIPEEIRCVPAERCFEINDGDLKSVKLPFSEIISLPEQGIWALVVREPHPQIAARSFVTHVGLRARNDEEVEFGIFTDIVSETLFSELRAKFNRIKLGEGDILIIEPKAFGGTIRTRQYQPGLNEGWYLIYTGTECFSRFV